MKRNPTSPPIPWRQVLPARRRSRLPRVMPHGRSRGCLGIWQSHGCTDEDDYRWCLVRVDAQGHLGSTWPTLFRCSRPLVGSSSWTTPTTLSPLALPLLHSFNPHPLETITATLGKMISLYTVVHRLYLLIPDLASRELRTNLICGTPPLTSPPSLLGFIVLLARTLAT